MKLNIAKFLKNCGVKLSSFESGKQAGYFTNGIHLLFIISRHFFLK